MSNVNARVVLLCMFMLSLLFMMSSGARIGPGIMTDKSESAHLMRRELEYYRRMKIALDAGPTRVAPGGPDPQHHSKTPAHS